MIAQQPRISRLTAAGAVIALVVTVAAIGRTATAGSYDAADLSRFERLSGIDLPDRYAAVPWLLTWTRGDGTTFVTLAADLDASDHTLRLGSAGYRYARVGFAAAVRLAAGGSIALLPVALMGVNLAAMVAVGAMLARRIEQPRDWIFFGASMCGLVIAAVTGTSEVFATLLVLIGIAAIRPWSTSAAFVLGTVRPEYAILLLLRQKERALDLMAAAFGAILVRVIAVSYGLDALSGASQLDLPGVGHVRAIAQQSPIRAALTAVTAVAGLALLVHAFRTRRPLSAHAAAGLFILVLGLPVLASPNYVIRVLAPFPILGFAAYWNAPAAGTPTATLSDNAAIRSRR